jgi:predicted dithiol-disulfide oxidoreductase (DUF899 family)
VFDAPEGRVTLSDLFAGRSQLAVYHFMFGPDWKEGCHRCSFWADSFDGIDVHLAHRLQYVAREHRGLQKAHGVALQVGLRARQRLQP